MRAKDYNAALLAMVSSLAIVCSLKTLLLSLLVASSATHPAFAADGFVGETDDLYPVVVSANFDQDPGEWIRKIESFDVLGSKREQGGIQVGMVLHSPEDLDLLETLNVPFQVIPEPKENERQDVLRHRNLYESINNKKFRCYRTVEGLYATMQNLTSRFSDLVTVKDIGDSWEKTQGQDPSKGYAILAMQITAPDNSRKKAPFFVTGGVHAREYASPELVTRFAEKLAEGYGVDADITWILNHTVVHIVPVVNPDGRKMAEARRNRWWRKNTHFNGCQSGNPLEKHDGVDINRQYPFGWGGDGSSSQKCSPAYRGPEALSEPESQAVAAYAKQIFSQTRGNSYEDSFDKRKITCEADAEGVYIDVHSYGGLIYYPWGYADINSPDDEGLRTGATKLASFGGYGLWGPGQPDFLYPASGDTTDFMYGHHCAAAFGFEVGSSFHEKCDSFEEDILPTNIGALIWAAKVASAPFEIGKGPDVLKLKAGKDRTTLKVRVKVSDSERAEAYGEVFDTGLQKISKVCAFIDVHPYDTSASCIEMNAVDGTFDSTTERAKVDIDIDNLPRGKHTVFVEAEDVDGSKGPVSASFFQVRRP